MKTNLSLVVLFFLISASNSFAQDGLKNRDSESPFSLGIQTGLTINTDYVINREFSSVAYGFNYFEGGVNYKISKNFELGVSYGRNDFTVKRPHITKAIYPTIPDTTYDTTQTFVLRNSNFLTFNLNYYFGDNLFAGLKGGAGDRSGILFGGNFGSNLLSSDEWELNVLAQAFMRFETEVSSKDISYQINLLFNVRFKPDIWGIF